MKNKQFFKNNDKEISIVLLRHGMTEANEKHLYCGKTDVPLSEKGERMLFQKKEESSYPDLSGFKIFTSGMKRAAQTLGILYPELKGTEEELADFSEINFGDFEMKSYEELKTNDGYKKWVQNMVDRKPDENDFPCPNGESWLAMKKRAVKRLESLLKNYRSFAIFTHGGIISAIMMHFFPDERKSIYEWSPDFGDGCIIRLKHGGRTLASYEKVPFRKNQDFSPQI